MKKVISLVLVLIMCLTLCACGGNTRADGDTESTSTEKTTIEYFREANTLPTPDSVTALTMLTSRTKSCNGTLTDIFYSYRSLNPANQAPTLFDEYLSYLKEHGFTVEENGIYVDVSLDGIHLTSISITGTKMELGFNLITPPAKEDDGKYTAYEFDGEPVDKLTIEEVVLEPKYLSSGDHYLTWKIKVRNTSGADLPMKESNMRVWYRYLDENEDVLLTSFESGGYSSTVKDGQAEWIKQAAKLTYWDNSDVDAIAYVEFYGYATTLAAKPDYEFTEYVTINLRDYFEW